jgi:hypothetical protein
MITTARTILMVGCWVAVLLCVGRGQGADAVVAPNGDGQFKSIQDAIMAAPQGLPSAARPWGIRIRNTARGESRRWPWWASANQNWIWRDF